MGLLMVESFRVKPYFEAVYLICLSAEQGLKFGWEKFTGRIQMALVAK